MDTADNVITSEDTLPEDFQIAHAWRDDNWLVLHEKKAVLPRRCVLCDALVDRKPIKVSLDTSSSTSGFGLLAFGLLAVVLTSILSPRATLRLCFCNEHLAKDRRSRRITCCVVAVALLVFASSIAIAMAIGTTDADIAWVAVALLFGFLALVGGLVFATLRPKLIHAKKIDKPFVWLEDVSPDYLARFPKVPRE